MYENTYSQSAGYECLVTNVMNGANLFKKKENLRSCYLKKAVFEICI